MSTYRDENHWRDDGGYYAGDNYQVERSRPTARTRKVRGRATISNGGWSSSGYHRQTSNIGRERDSETTVSSSRFRGRRRTRNRGQGRGRARIGWSNSEDRGGARSRGNDGQERGGATSRWSDSEGSGGAISLWSDSEDSGEGISRGNNDQGRGRGISRGNNDQGRGRGRSRGNNDQGRGRGRSRGNNDQGRGGGRSRGNNDQGRGGARGREIHNQDGNNEEAPNTRNARNRENRRKRENPIGYKPLESLLDMYPDEVVTKLQLERSGYNLLISNNEEITNDKMCLLLRVLHHASTAQVNRENLNTLLVQTFKPHFIHRLVTFSVMIELEYSSDPEKMSVFFQDLCGVLQVYTHSMPTRAADQILPLVLSAVMICERSTTPKCARLATELKDLQNLLEDEKKKVNLSNNREGRSSRQRWEEHLAPPDNFREISVLPTTRDIQDLVHPFLRSNKIEGFYADADHYLDVQFRLLREDFVRPLRNGIHEYRSQTHSKNMDVRIYENVKILGTDVAKREIIYYVQIRLRKNVNLENSKRLLYGNLLCFSADRFKTFIMGSVAERKMDMLKKGVLGVKFESDIDKSLSFTMIESRAYFMAYKHVLCALQEITEDSFPLPEYIIDVHPGEIRPAYVTRRTFYDLQVLRDPKMMKESERYNQLFVPESNLDDFTSHRYRPHLENVLLINDIAYWPPAAEMGFDESQRRALKSALTKKLAIIQGPPGTGKTFIGLKITQTLLYNSDAWKRKGQTPILVVCFTNHALDQFLEGIAEFTQSIVRVGSRTQSERISQFQINSLVMAAKRSRKIPYDVYEMNQNRHQDVLEAEAELMKWKGALEETESPQGILRPKVFLNEKVTTTNIALQMESISLKSWLMDAALFERWQKKENLTAGHEGLRSPPSKTDENSDDDIWEDAEELLVNEENDRILYEGDSELRKSATPKQILDYEVNTHTLEQELSRMTSANGTEFKDIQQEITQRQRTQALKKELDILKSGFQIMSRNSTATLERRESTLYLWNLDFQDRWLLYKILLSRIYDKLKTKLQAAEQEFRRCSKAWEEIRCQEMLHVMRNASVVGMTTTGAAQNTALLRSLQPAIVIVEEAAEILEAHVITALSSRCEHLIMIGDHQQLQPSATVYDLARNFNLETSLFERMIKNKLPYDTLEYQHRMRPDISCLLVPSIYPTLKDHQSVHTYPNIKGVAANVFFISHTHYEDKVHSDDNSRQNEYEGNLMMALCRHLRLQGYSPDKITILTPYSGQYFLLKKLQRKYHVCEGVKICIVDNFQGEENDIILLSLVRSNLKGQVGFLKKENRVCVALSRARHGLYIAGNINQLSAEAKLWVNIKETLKKNKAIGPSLTLRCENHPEQLMSVSSGEDFLIKSPEGGCMKPCSSLLSCGHRCPKTCHMTKLHHNDVKCPVPCPKMCKRNHPCRQKCWEKCDPCMEIIQKTLPCGHTHNVRCSQYESNDIKCPTIVERVLPTCEHSVKMRCHRNPATYPCPVPCDIRLDCGHQCTRSCHTRDDPDHLTFKCAQPCTRSPEGCSKGHRCKKPCWEDCGPCNEFVKKMRSCGHWHTVKCHVKKEDIFCTENCRKELSCKHPCPRKCSEPCGGCPVKVKKIVPDCRHEIQVECRQQPLRSMCKERCTLTLPCGHACTARCCETCTEKCLHRVRSTNICPKGHVINLPCYLRTKTGEVVWQFCNSTCGAVLNCDHPCTGNCGTCLHGRLHAPCGQKCQRSLPCGHVCKAACGADCPPCQDACPLRCQHSRCSKRCGEPCNDCQEKCLRRCAHRQCKAICSETCTVEPCEEPCPKTLPCKHACVGFCGDPCPPLCRICDNEELSEILFGSEDEEDARFVLLEECGHVIEADGLKNWLSRDEGEISMKKCPKCQSPIYNNRRFKEYIKQTFENIQALKLKYYTQKQGIQKKDIEQILTDPNIVENFQGEVEQIKLSIRQNPSNDKSEKVKYLSDAAMNLLKFQASVLQKLHKILHSHPNESRYLKVESSFLLKRVMSQNLRISEQMMEEVTCELQRLSVLPAVWKIYDRYKETKLHRLGKVVKSLSESLHASRKFDIETETNIRKLLKDGEKFVGGLGVTNEERLMILKAMQLRQGHWYKCRNGHIYCITECGGAMEEKKCPECGATIGGTSHTLRQDNAVATEMDGARHAAWSEHANMANFDMGDLV